jgi:GMP synthase-like glutamine amidotransferase
MTMKKPVGNSRPAFSFLSQKLVQMAQCDQIETIRDKGATIGHSTHCTFVLFRKDPVINSNKSRL